MESYCHMLLKVLYVQTEIIVEKFWTSDMTNSFKRTSSVSDSFKVHNDSAEGKILH